MVLRGLLAGAAGTMALDVYTYGDMTVRGRAASEVPAKTAGALAERVGLDAFAHGDDDATKNRRSGAGALFGYGVGLGAGLGYALVRPAFQSWLPWPIAGLALGLTTLVLSEGSATKLGATDWSQWTFADWISDIVPRSLYGLTVAAVLERT